MGYKYYVAPCSIKSKTAALLLCIFGGFFGWHQFYAGKIGKGILYFLTGGVFGIMWIIDIFRILFNSFPDSTGLYITGKKSYRQNDRRRDRQNYGTVSGGEIALWALCGVLVLGIIGALNNVLFAPGTGTVMTADEYMRLQEDQAARQIVSLTDAVSVSDTFNEQDLKLNTGELLSVITNERDGLRVIVIKAKIQGLFDDNMTIDQNFHNACDLITRQGCDSYDELQYWAVADMNDGSEQKVIAFTLDKQTIQGIKDQHILPNELTIYSDDLWIHPSLLTEEQRAAYITTTEDATITTAETNKKTTAAQTTATERKTNDTAEQTTAASAKTTTAASNAETDRITGKYIGNLNENTDGTHKFHRPNCGSLPKEENRVYFDSREEAINQGYVPCKNCNP